MTAKEMRIFHAEQRKLKDGEYATEYMAVIDTVLMAVKKDPSIDYVDIGRISKPVIDRLKGAPNFYTVEYHQSGQIDYEYRISWED